MCAAAALRLSPRLGRAFFELAACHEASGNYDAALRDAELAKGCVNAEPSYRISEYILSTLNPEPRRCT